MKKYSLEKTEYFLLFCLFILTAGKLVLIGEGYLAFPDESRYANSISAIDKISDQDFKGFLKDIFSTEGRPADALIRIIPAGIQRIVKQVTGIHEFHSDNSFALFAFNFLFYCLTLILIYKISILLLKDKILTLLVVILYSVQTNSHLYLRHAVPYDLSLPILYFALFQILINYFQKSYTLTKAIFGGAIAFFGYMVYPGYFPLYIISFGLLFSLYPIKSIQNLKYIVGFGAGSAICLLIFEVASRAAGQSYLNSAIALSGTVIQGSFDETFSFLFKYLFQIEKVSGLILLSGMIAFFYTLNKSFKDEKYEVNILAIITLCVFVIYAGAGFFFEKVVLYGRLLHQYFPLFCIFSVFGLKAVIDKFKNFSIIWTFLVIILCINFSVNLFEYIKFAYPRDDAFKNFTPDRIRIVDISGVCEHQNSWSVFPYEIKSFGTDYKGNKNSNFEQVIVQNYCYFYPVKDLSKFNKYQPDTHFKLLSSKPHFLGYKAYQFEAYSVRERKNLDKMDLRINVYSNK